MSTPHTIVNIKIKLRLSLVPSACAAVQKCCASIWTTQQHVHDWQGSISSTRSASHALFAQGWHNLFGFHDLYIFVQSSH